METEIEVKFLSVDIDDIRKRLAGAGAVCEVPVRIMRRVAVDSADMSAKNGYLRVRDEGDKATATYKQFDGTAIDSAREIEVVVSDFQSMVDLLAAAGLHHTSAQETRRETWKLGAVEVVIDEWPWLDPYVEIEGDSEMELREAAEQLGFDWSVAVFGDVMAAYRAQYPHLTNQDNIGSIADVRFGMPLPDLFKP